VILLFELDRTIEEPLDLGGRQIRDGQQVAPAKRRRRISHSVHAVTVASRMAVEGKAAASTGASDLGWP
jgi:hypothetical protein